MVRISGALPIGLDMRPRHVPARPMDSAEGGGELAQPASSAVRTTTSNRVVTSRRVYQARRTRMVIAQRTTRLTPKRHTIVAPVGRSIAAEAVTPRTLPTVPNAQPTISRVGIEPPIRIEARAGTIRYEKTSSTPAMRTELVTTTPNKA